MVPTHLTVKESMLKINLPLTCRKHGFLTDFLSAVESISAKIFNSENNLSPNIHVIIVQSCSCEQKDNLLLWRK